MRIIPEEANWEAPYSHPQDRHYDQPEPADSPGVLGHDAEEAWRLTAGSWDGPSRSLWAMPSCSPNPSAHPQLFSCVRQLFLPSTRLPWCVVLAASYLRWPRMWQAGGDSERKPVTKGMPQTPSPSSAAGRGRVSAGRCSPTRLCLWHLSRTRFHPASWAASKMCEGEAGGENQCILWSRMEAGEGAS